MCGGYTIKGISSTFIEYIIGDPNSTIGLPINKVC